MRDACNAAAAGIIFLLNSATLGFVLSAVPRIHQGEARRLKQRFLVEQCYRQHVIRSVLTKSAASRIQNLTVVQRGDVTSEDHESMEDLLSVLKHLSQSPGGLRHLQ